MTRLALGIEYEGTAYYGWQRQLETPSIQSAIEAALSHIADQPIEINCAGRTDRGVHALAQVIHFDTEVKRVPQAWTLGVNSILPKDIRVTWVKEVTTDFHARYSATARRYQYILYNNPLRPGLWGNHVSWHYFPVQLAPMQQAASCLLGEHDFSSFRAADCQSHTTHRHMHHLTIQQQGDFFIFDIKANAFLHHMVRNIVGSLLVIGEGKQAISWLKDVLEAKDRRQAGATAPASGLYLSEVEYPEDFQIPKIATNFPYIKSELC